MHVYPRVELAGGESVLSLPDPKDAQRPFVSGPDVAERFVEMGARRLLVVDVDRATSEGDNDDQLLRLLDRAPVPVDVGGGVRSMRRIQELLDTGAARVHLCTMGAMHLDWLAEVRACFGDRVVASLDVRQGRVLIDGRKKEAPQPLERLVPKVDELGLAGIHLQNCDPAGNGELAAWAGRIQGRLGLGGTHADASALEAMAAARVAAVVLGAEAYSGRLDAEAAFGAYSTV